MDKFKLVSDYKLSGDQPEKEADPISVRGA